MTYEKVIRNRLRCRKCDTIVESKHRHDFARCRCGACAADGGLEYLRRVGDLDAMEELSEVVEVTDDRLDR
jgi:hypothetical protein